MTSYRGKIVSKKTPLKFDKQETETPAEDAFVPSSFSRRGCCPSTGQAIDKSSGGPSHGCHGDAAVNDRHAQTKCSEWSLWPVPGGSLEPAPECQREKKKKEKKSHYGPNCPTKAELPGLYLAWPAAMTQSSKLMMEVKHQNTEKSKRATACTGQE